MRKAWEVLHWSLGYISLALGIITIFLGIEQLAYLSMRTVGSRACGEALLSNDFPAFSPTYALPPSRPSPLAFRPLPPSRH